ncbi:IS66-like element accessory protein TnpA [Aquisalimonas sp. APHAB1-3]|uniref:IS66-like element accessory protein TnpA n=1 Tax=Aquisalimonas sp. APHAB1-3 TaxID=3402080 RepID=UPI003AAD31B4
MDINEEHPPAVGVDRRRRFTLGYKRRVVEETLTEGASVSVVARRHDVNANQLFRWRKLYREGLLQETTGTSAAALVPIHVADTPVAAATEPKRSPTSGNGELEITLSGGHRVVVRGDADGAALRVVLEVLSR